ncbi:DUF1211 domain-containing protein [Mycobacterium sp. Y57]|nr:DUF1211 domain-containing protein [Mycolicibacterium xanthum]
MPKSRLEAFSDGVYAIALTLLVIGLHVPESSDRLLEELTDEWPSLLGYLVSFAFIGGSWFVHTNLTRLLATADSAFAQLNLLLLLFVTFLPFTTGVLAAHLTGSGQRLAVVLFGANLTLAEAMLGVLSTYVARNPDLVHQAGPELRGFAKVRWAFTTLLVLSTVAGWFVPQFAVGFYLVVSALILIQPIRLLERRSRLAHQRNRRKPPIERQ